MENFPVGESLTWQISLGLVDWDSPQAFPAVFLWVLWEGKQRLWVFALSSPGHAESKTPQWISQHCFFNWLQEYCSPLCSEQPSENSANRLPIVSSGEPELQLVSALTFAECVKYYTAGKCFLSFISSVYVNSEAVKNSISPRAGIHKSWSFLTAVVYQLKQYFSLALKMWGETCVSNQRRSLPEHTDELLLFLCKNGHVDRRG